MYCANCGVKLADTEKKCPLCGVTAFHPDIVRPEGESFYPNDTFHAQKVSPWGTMVVVTMTFLLPIIITLMCDLQLNEQITWSGYVMGALLLVYTCCMLPIWFRNPNPVVFLPIDFFAIGVYLFYINYATHGSWYFAVALPTVIVVCLIMTAVIALLRYLKKGRLYIFGGAFTALGIYMPIMEYLITASQNRETYLGWSFYPLITLVLLGGLLLFLAICKPARESMERKFFI